MYNDDGAMEITGIIMKSCFLLLVAVAWLASPLLPCFADSPSLAEVRTRAEQGYAEAQNQLGWIYYKGVGVPQDYTEVVKWIRKAAEQGYARAQNELGLMYRYGYGVTADSVKSYVWFLLAAAQGDASAKTNLDSIESFMASHQIAEAQERAAAWRPIPSKQ